VAIQARSSDSFLVIVGMAGQAGSCEPEIGELFVFYLDIRDKLSLVAILAFFLCVSASQWKPRQLVIEFLSVKANDLECYAMVIAMAGCTVFIFNFCG